MASQHTRTRLHPLPHTVHIIILTVANAKITSKLPQTFLVSSAPLFFVLEDVAAVPVAVPEVVAFLGTTALG